MEEIYQADDRGLSKYFFCFGTRMHGNMFAYLHGIPSLWVVHDARTFEMCEAMQLPYVLLNDLSERTTIDSLFLKAKYDNLFYQHRGWCRQQYIDFLNENGVPHNFKSSHL